MNDEKLREEINLFLNQECAIPLPWNVGRQIMRLITTHKSSEPYVGVNDKGENTVFFPSEPEPKYYFQPDSPASGGTTQPKVEPTEVFNCPACPNQGWYTDGYQLPNGEFEPQQVQCEFCYTHPKSVFNYMQKVKVSDFKIINETGELK